MSPKPKGSVPGFLLNPDLGTNHTAFVELLIVMATGPAKLLFNSQYRNGEIDLRPIIRNRSCILYSYMHKDKGPEKLFQRIHGSSR